MQSGNFELFTDQNVKLNAVNIFPGKGMIEEMKNRVALLCVYTDGGTRMGMGMVMVIFVYVLITAVDAYKQQTFTFVMRLTYCLEYFVAYQIHLGSVWLSK